MSDQHAERMRAARERVRRFKGGCLPDWLKRALDGKPLDLDEWQLDFLAAWIERHGDSPSMPNEKPPLDLATLTQEVVEPDDEPNGPDGVIDAEIVV